MMKQRQTQTEYELVQTHSSDLWTSTRDDHVGSGENRICEKIVVRGGHECEIASAML